MEVLKFINSELKKANIPYEYGEWTSKVPDVYFVGEYTESETFTEDGIEEKTFILNGFTRKSALYIEQIKEKIKSIFPKTGKTAILENGSGIVVFYSNSFPIPTGSELKRIQINLKVKLWKAV